MEFFIDLSGRSRQVGRRNIAIAVSKVGYIHVRLIERVQAGRHAVDRTAIVTLQPRLVSQPTLAALGYKLANLDPERTVVVADFPVAKCWVFVGHMSALRMIGAIVAGDGETSSPADACERPV